MKPFSAEELRRSISPRASDALTAWILPAFVVLLFGSAAVIVICHAWQEGDLATVFEFAGLFLGMLAVVILVGVLGMRQVKTAGFIKEQRLAALSEEQLIFLADEIAQEKLRYGSFYFLDNYVYFPQAGALIHYHDIAKWRVVQDHFFGFTDHVWVEVTETSGFVQRYSIRQRRSFLKEAYSVLEEMEQRKWDAA